MYEKNFPFFVVQILEVNNFGAKKCKNKNLPSKYKISKNNKNFVNSQLKLEKMCFFTFYSFLILYLIESDHQQIGVFLESRTRKEFRKFKGALIEKEVSTVDSKKYYFEKT